MPVDTMSESEEFLAKLFEDLKKTDRFDQDIVRVVIDALSNPEFDEETALAELVKVAEKRADSKNEQQS